MLLVDELQLLQLLNLLHGETCTCPASCLQHQHVLLQCSSRVGVLLHGSAVADPAHSALLQQALVLLLQVLVLLLLPLDVRLTLVVLLLMTGLIGIIVIV
jgi:hypothetical protein